MKREEKSKQSKAKIIQAAFSLFASKGYDATSTQDIIELSGLSRGAMYHHFKSKEEILRSLMNEIYTQTSDFLEELVADQTLSAKEKITKIIMNSGDDYMRRQLAQASWVEKVPFALLESIRNLNDYVAPQVTKIVKQGIENGEYTCDYPEALSETLLFIVEIWLDPTIIKREYAEICNRFDFLYLLLQKLEVPLIDEEDIQKFKAIFKPNE
ncbi:TetR/AcrR family transcriptional regulator [Candidatus Enterococcus ferrettii]|uniref:HTH tetR-type domain-containing protein n=1 Tax=Candidatus Enterococcus ferrettii TaxID=2815324 RepID=A0ABV0ESG9_9ENTE|nr:TetR/AcrR family transcriptional regulator [Enterococcus sp. 665A]MBO1339305.1 TetR/AcrR family transcriptional regulator [Enterococcus sp. 665A]